MPRARSWWRLKQLRHRDAVVLSVLSAAFLLAGELANQDVSALYLRYLAPVAGQPLVFAMNAALVVLAFTTVFGGILVLLGGIHFSWGRVTRGRFLLILGIGFTALGLAGKLAVATLNTGSPLSVLVPLTTTLTGIGLLLGLAAQIFMAEYALMIKKHAQTMWRRWRRVRRPSRRGSRY